MGGDYVLGSRVQKDPALIPNDLELAKELLALRLSELEKTNGSQLGTDAITRHIRAVRNRLVGQDRV
jgi:hypothetical protein